LYATYIHDEDWNAYMGGLCQEESASSVRKFIPLTKDSFILMDRLLDTAGKRDFKMQTQLSDNDLVAYGINPSQRKDDESEAKAFGRKLKVALNAKRKLGMKDLSKCYYFEKGTAFIDVLLDNLKMSAASGKRSGEPSQKAVMSNVSATDVSIQTALACHYDYVIAD
jgi:hypothetical protein